MVDLTAPIPCRSAAPRRAPRRALLGLLGLAPLAPHGRRAAAQATEGDPGNALPFNGFRVVPSAVPAERIVRGGPPRDGIPSIDRPRFVSAARSELARDDRVLGVAAGGLAKAYPIRILNWHEVVNDRLAEAPIALTYCPLCGSGVVFESTVSGRVLSFGVSGLLLDNDVLLYDRQTESLWSQLKYRAITGPMLGTTLARVPAEHTTWADWRTRHPRTDVLSFETGFERDYARDPYAGYARDPATFYPLSREDARLDPKTWVLGVERNGASRAYPIAALGAGSGTLRDVVGGETVLVHFDGRHGTARATDAKGKPIPAVTAFWFAWAVFNPGTDVYRPAATR
jgi:hypothetical protein